METSELIHLLTQLPPTRRPLRLGVLLMCLTGFAAVTTISILGLRPELLALHPPLSFWIKTALLAIIMAATLRALTAASKPVPSPQTRNQFFIPLVFAIALVMHEWLTVPAPQILSSFAAINFPSCLFFVTLYGGIGMAALTLLLRHYAPANLKNCAGLAGLAAASAGAVGYSIHCPFDSPTFIVVAYGLPMFLLWLAARALLPRFLKW